MSALGITVAEAEAESLAKGTAGTALLAVELALTGAGPWPDAHAAIIRATSAPVDGTPSGCLLHGAPALAFVLSAARADGAPRYQAAAGTLGRLVHRAASQRLDDAQTRIAGGEPGTFREYDLFYGLTGIGVVLLRTAPDSETLAAILAYLSGLVNRPLSLDGLEVPAWWAARDPDPLSPTPGGHANLGMAHGAAGILAFLSLAAISGRVVDGQREAIDALHAWFEQWRQDSGSGPWWPQWVTRDDVRNGRPAQQRPGRPSWCYGAPGIARALQLAAISAADPTRQAAAERALAASLTESKLAGLADAGLCHGIAGVYRTAARAADDEVTPAISSSLPKVAAALTARAGNEEGSAALLTGTAGIRLALETLRRCAPPISGWDACLLLT